MCRNRVRYIAITDHILDGSDNLPLLDFKTDVLKTTLQTLTPEFIRGKELVLQDTHHLRIQLPPWRIQNDGHDATRDRPGDGDSDDPPKVDPPHQPDIDGPPVAVRQADTNRRAGDALSLLRS